MALRRDLLLGVIVLAALHAVLSFGAIGLFSRMAPEIERIIRANVVSLEACEAMLAALALTDGDEAERQLKAALAIASANITESPEKTLIATIQRNYRDAVKGSAGARRETLAAILALGQVNRDAMRRSDEEAQRLGNAGSWAAVFLAMTSFTASVVVIRRIRRRVVVPLGRIHDTLVAVRQGNLHRRCPTTGISHELALLATEVNGLVERIVKRSVAPTAAKSKDSLNRAMLLHVLDALPGPAVFVNARGDMLASNRAAIDLLSGPRAIAIVAALESCGRSGPALGDLIESVNKVGASEVWCCTLAGAAGVSSDARPST
ncbi:MAG: hypothetical protein MUC50_09080 [Myxococcota bacterium]|jgi:methyl-accepting chemotaxis protein|nr:hypothetical protein [Myxococcota bacterium]